MLSRFSEHNLQLKELTDVIPENDTTTLFLCSGMQRWKPKFSDQTQEKFGSLQTCIRTNDIREVGDGSHLTSFKMLGNFSFGNNDYHLSVELWNSILCDLKLKSRSVIHIHPTQGRHKQLWQRCGYQIIDDTDCVWSDGQIGGYCCEVYYDGLEIGNLVNPLEHSTDVGFGLERLLQVISGTKRVDETELFDTTLSPICRDHFRTLEVLKLNGINPGNKEREYVCRRLLRRCLLEQPTSIPNHLRDWLNEEHVKRQKCIKNGKKHWNKHSNQPPQWWKETFGILPEELHLLK